MKHQLFLEAFCQIPSRYNQEIDLGSSTCVVVKRSIMFTTYTTNRAIHKSSRVTENVTHTRQNIQVKPHGSGHRFSGLDSSVRQVWALDWAILWI